MQESQVKITPAMAARMLQAHQKANDGNTGNWRTYRVPHAEFLAYEILAGNFLPEAGKIVLGNDGYIIDGQHRINAVLLSDTAVTFTVIEGAPRSWGERIDCGVSRTVAQRLQLSPKVVGVLGTMIRVAYRDPSAGKSTAVKQAYQKFGPYLATVSDMKGWATPQKHTSAPVRAAILLTLSAQGTAAPLAAIAAYLAGDLQTLAMGEYTGLLTLYKALLAGTLIGSNNVGAQEVLLKALGAFQYPKKKTLARVSDVGESVAAEVWPLYARVMGIKGSLPSRRRLPGKVSTREKRAA